MGSGGNRRGRAVIIAGQPTREQIRFASAQLVLEGRHVIVFAVILPTPRLGDKSLQPIDAAVTGERGSRAFLPAAFLSGCRRNRVTIDAIGRQFALGERTRLENRTAFFDERLLLGRLGGAAGLRGKQLNERVEARLVR